jgi:metal-responsive CopG/Arc/MetJ family transcriptional regulator
MKTDRRDQRARREATVRASVSFPSELYHLLEQVALHKKVSVAWVVRDAAEKYISHCPMLEKEF